MNATTTSTNRARAERATPVHTGAIPKPLPSRELVRFVFTHPTKVGGVTSCYRSRFESRRKEYEAEGYTVVEQKNR